MLLYGEASQNDNYKTLFRQLERDHLAGHLDAETLDQITKALARLTKPKIEVSEQRSMLNISVDEKLAVDLDLIYSGIERYKPAYLSNRALTSAFTGALKGTFLLAIMFAIAPAAPLWLCFVIPSMYAAFDYLFDHHLQAQDVVRRKVTVLEAYLRERAVVALVNEREYFSNTFTILSHSPFLHDALTQPLTSLQKILVERFQQGRISLQGGIALHYRMEELMQALVDTRADVAYAKLVEIESLLAQNQLNKFDITKRLFVVALVVSIGILALSVISAGTLPAFLATTLSVTLFTSQWTMLGLLFDSVGNACAKSRVNHSFSPFASKVKTFFSAFQDANQGTKIIAKDVVPTREDSVGELDCRYLALATVHTP